MIKKWFNAAEKWPYALLSGYFIKWIVLGSFVGLMTGSASAFFLYSLDYVTSLRMENPWLLFFLPLGGAGVSFLYYKFGKSCTKGNNLILEQIHGGTESVPLRMAPLVLIGTLVTHLFGGSAGREGTAVQMGGSLSEWFGKLIRVTPADRKILLICGISGGFGSIFGTPLAGTLFGLEVLAIGLISHQALLPAFVASLVGNLIATSLWGVSHLHFPIGDIPALSFLVILKVIFASILFGLTSRLFSELTHSLKQWYGYFFRNPMIKSAVGGIIIIALVYLLGTREYLGLGLPLIEASFTDEVSPLAFLGKILFTSLTLGAGFQGGEVTPLFAIGATLGNALSEWIGLYAPFLAALGFIAVFCGATNTPIACFIMGIELFGGEGAVYMLMACVISYLFSGHSGIYTSQQIGISKHPLLSFPLGTTLAGAKTLNKQKHKQKTSE